MIICKMGDDSDIHFEVLRNKKYGVISKAEGGPYLTTDIRAITDKIINLFLIGNQIPECAFAFLASELGGKK